MSIKGAGCLLWFRDERGQIILVTGKESIYLSDSVSEVTIDKIPTRLSELQRVRVPVNEDKIAELQMVKEAFSRNALKIQEVLRREIKFDTPSLVPSGGGGTQNEYQCNFRILPSMFKRGISKGGIEMGESSEVTARREIIEELGMKLNTKDMVPLGVFNRYEMYEMDMQKTRIGSSFEISREIEKRISSRTKLKYGELFDVSLKTLDQVLDTVCRGEFNEASALAVRQFVQIHGSPQQIERIEAFFNTRSLKSASGKGVKKSTQKNKKRRTRQTNAKTAYKRNRIFKNKHF
jgi:8-oxo-dGTP pyrophosphatase MutT (NUDIX family)